MHLTDTILMVRPAAFTYNAETARDNFFQLPSEQPAEALQRQALAQFDAMVERLRAAGINVWVVEDTPEPVKPDAVFPNNWLVTTAEGVLSVFPMYAPNRRNEVRDDILLELKQRYRIDAFHDWTEYGAEGQYLEGTGSMVLDRSARIIYAARSERTHESLVAKWAAANRYRVLTFDAADAQGRPVYHTNVLLSVGEGFAVLCPKAITDDVERVAVAQLLETTGHENIYLSFEQMEAFAANLLQVRNTEGEPVIVLSQTALDALRDDQRERLERHGKLLPVDVSVMERINGGSTRCMMAEIFLSPAGAGDPNP